MTFVHWGLFWALLVPFLALSVLVLTNADRVNRIFKKDVLERILVSDGGMSKRARDSILLLSAFFMIVALARPVKQIGEKRVQIKGLSVLSAIDISGSMRSQDSYPNRLEFAKVKMKQFFDAMNSDDISIVAFASRAFLLAPFTSDKETLKMLIDGVDSSYISQSATDFERVVDLAAQVLKKKEPKILVLFTDGGDKKSIKELKQKLKDEQIDLFVVLVGSKKGGPVLDKNAHPLSFEGKLAITKRNDALGELAKELGGAFVIAANGKKDMLLLAQNIHSRYHSKKQAEILIKERIEYFYFPLGLSLALLLVGFSSLPKREVKA